MGTRYFAVISGIVYLLVGILGFIPGLVTAPVVSPDLVVNAGYGYLLGIFPINLLHNLVHLAVGIWGIAAFGNYYSARNYSRGLAIFYGVLAIMGFFPVLQTTFGLIPIYGNDIWLHAITALIAAYFGFASRPTPTAVRADERTTVAGRDRY